MKTKICTSIEQSKKLIELGIDVNTADMVYLLDVTMGNRKHRVLTKDDFAATDGINISAWSLTALLELMPDTIQGEDGVMFGLNVKKNYCEYYNPSMGILYAIYQKTLAENTFDAVFEMVCWLLENKK